MNVLEFLEEYNYLFALGVSAISWLVGFSTTTVADKIKIGRLKKVLRLKKSETKMMLPVRSGTVKMDTVGDVTEIRSDFVTLSESMSIYDIGKTAQDAGSVCSILTSADDYNEKNNLFCVGGPLSNPMVAQYFRKFFPSVKFGCGPSSTYINDLNRESLSDFIYIDESDEENTVDFGGRKLAFKPKSEGYIILARLNGKEDFCNRDHGTVHICFGRSAVTTRAATKAYYSHCKELYNRLKGRKGHYFAVIKCSHNGEIDFSTFTDLTDEVFSKA